MTGDGVLLATVVATALAFDFTNGFHDTANAMATTVATRAMRPRAAVLLAAVLNFVGALLSLSVAATIASGIVDSGEITVTVVFAGLVGGITWNLVTWVLGMPSSSSHALIGGVVGATLVAAGTGAVHFSGVVTKVLLPALLAPVVATVVAGLVTVAVYRLTTRLTATGRDRGFRAGQIGSASLVSLAHGTNDAQKTMGVIMLALIAGGSLGADAEVPTWVILSCALAIALGTYAGGWRIIRTLGKGLVEIEPAQGFSAEASSASVILISSHYGLPLSTTQVCTGSVIGTGLGRRWTGVRWSVARQMALAWLLTLPAAAGVGASAWAIAELIGGLAGVLVVFTLAAVVAAALFARSRRNAVTHENVNAAWQAPAPPVPAAPLSTPTAPTGQSPEGGKPWIAAIRH